MWKNYKFKKALFILDNMDDLINHNKDEMTECLKELSEYRQRDKYSKFFVKILFLHKIYFYNFLIKTKISFIF